MDRQYVGIDLHRRRSVIHSMDADGEKLDCVRIANDPMSLLEVVGKAGPEAEVVIEATYGWYWAVDLLQDAGFRVHLAHPSGNDWGNRRVKNDERDARDLADLLRLGRLAEAWIAPPAVREVRELVRYRAKLAQLRSGLKAQVHAVMGKEGVLPRRDDMFGPGGQRQLDEIELGDVFVVRVESLRDLIEVYDREVAMLERKIHQLLRDDPSYQGIQALNGVGRTIAAIFVAEIGDVTRFRSAEALCSWAGLAPRHRESDTKVVRGSITKMGSRLVRWAALEAVARYHGGAWLQPDFHRIADRRGKNKARVAVARKLLTLVYYGLRDGEIRCLRERVAARALGHDPSGELADRHGSRVSGAAEVCD
jgi:transposase